MDRWIGFDVIYCISSTSINRGALLSIIPPIYSLSLSLIPSFLLSLSLDFFNDKTADCHRQPLDHQMSSPKLAVANPDYRPTSDEPLAKHCSPTTFYYLTLFTDNFSKEMTARRLLVIPNRVNTTFFVRRVS